MRFIRLSVPEFAKVRSWPSCEVNGQILVWFHCDGKDPQWTVPEQQEITKGEWVYRGRTEHYVNAHIQVGVCVCGCVFPYAACFSLFEDENQCVLRGFPLYPQSSEAK